MLMIIMGVQICNVGNLMFSYAYSTIEEAWPEMESGGFRLCSIKDIAELKIAQTMYNRNRADSIFDNGPILTKESVLCFPSNPSTARLMKNSPLLEPSAKYIPDKGIVIGPPQIARGIKKGISVEEDYFLVLAELKKTNFFPTKEKIAPYLEDSIEFPMLDKGNFGRFVELKDFKKNKLISYVFGANIDNYIKSLEKSNIQGIRIYPESANEIEGFGIPFVKQILYGRDETADICLQSTILFAHRMFCIFGIKD
jgi:hypothetical protein